MLFYTKLKLWYVRTLCSELKTGSKRKETQPIECGMRLYQGNTTIVNCTDIGSKLLKETLISQNKFCQRKTSLWRKNTALNIKKNSMSTNRI